MALAPYTDMTGQLACGVKGVRGERDVWLREGLTTARRKPIQTGGGGGWGPTGKEAGLSSKEATQSNVCVIRLRKPEDTEATQSSSKKKLRTTDDTKGSKGCGTQTGKRYGDDAWPTEKKRGGRAKIYGSAVCLKQQALSRQSYDGEGGGWGGVSVSCRSIGGASVKTRTCLLCEKNPWGGGFCDRVEI